MPLRLLNSWVGSIEMVSTAPGWQQDTNGWSSHRPRDRCGTEWCTRCGAPSCFGRQAAVRQPPEDEVLDAHLAAQLRLALVGAVFVDDEDVGLDLAELVHEVEQSHAAADAALLHAPERVDEVLPLVCGLTG